MPHSNGSPSLRVDQEWLQHTPKPRPRPKAVEWDVFISYRSVNRAWAMALHDTLKEAGYRIFLDQFVLRPGDELEETLEEQLKRSASAVLVWTQAASESTWVKSELRKMRSLAEEREDFHYVIAKLDNQPLPFLEQGMLYVDFAQYPEGPRGGELLRLMYGLAGKALTEEAARAIQELNEETTRVLHALSAARSQGQAERLKSIALAETPVLMSTPLPISLAADSLIALKQYDAALEVLAVACQRFPRSLRPRQLTGLALRRKGDALGALDVLEGLLAEGHRDPETLGIAAAAWTVRHRNEGKRLHLERAQRYYEEAFKLTPSDYYVGLNAASKRVLLGDVMHARELAHQVLPLVEGAEDGVDYWMTASHAEVRLLLGEYARAASLYRQAVVRHSEEHGSIATTSTEAAALLDALEVASDERTGVLQAFHLS